MQARFGLPLAFLLASLAACGESTEPLDDGGDSAPRDSSVARDETSLRLEGGTPGVDANAARDTGASSNDSSAGRDTGGSSNDSSAGRDTGGSSNDSSAGRDTGASSNDSSAGRDSGGTATDSSAGRDTGGTAADSTAGRDTGGTTNDSSAARDTGGTRDTGSVTDADTSGEPQLYGQVYSGGEFHLGPVDYEESHFHNACAPGGGYTSTIRSLEGNLLAGLWNGIPNTAWNCDACIFVKTAMGKSAILRVVTYGDTTPNSVDVSPEAFALLNSGEYPRTMTWQFAKCPDTGTIRYEFQSGSHEDWTSFWVRNARVPISRIEVRSARHPSFVTLQRGTDGTVNDGGGFGVGDFTIRLTGVDGSQLVHSFTWSSRCLTGTLLDGGSNFP